MNISAVSLSVLTDVQLKLEASYPGKTRFLARVGDHFGDLDGLVNRLSRAKSTLVDQAWVSYYFTRGALDLLDARIRKAFWPDPSDPGKAFEVLVVPLASVDLQVTFVSNHAPLLEDLEERISTRYLPLQGNFLARSPLLSSLDPIAFWYDCPDFDPSYRVDATALGSVSELQIPLRAYFPIFRLPESSSKLIREITFEIYLHPGDNLVARYVWTG